MKLSSRHILAAAAAMALAAPAALAGGPPHWLSRSELVSDGITRDGAVRVFDVTISYHGDPDGDNDTTTVDDRTPIEEAIQHFARGVWESTNKQHKLGKVRIFRKGRFSAQADVLWTESGHPSASVGGIQSAGQTINMFDVFKDGNGPGSDYNFLDAANRKGGGYTLAHEWGHYAYALLDEYRGGDPASNAILYFPHTTDNPSNIGIMNSQWNALGGDFSWINFSTSTRPGFTRQNAQYRVYNAAAWQTLARERNRDPRRGNAFPFTRPVYSELTKVAPNAENPTPPIDLASDGDNTGLDELEIIWMGEDLVTVIVIDRSGSMSGDAIVNARNAASLLVDLAEVDKSAIGVVSFSSSATVNQAITPIDGEATKTQIKSVIQSLNASGGTSIGAGATAALNIIVPFGAGDENKVVFLLSDGQSSDALTPIPAYQAARIPIFAFAYGTGADQAALRTLATQTGGQFFVSPTSLAELSQVFVAANTTTNSRSSLVSSSFPLTAAVTTEVPLPLDSTLRALDLSVAFSGAPADVQVGLIAPDSTSVAPVSTSQSAGETLVRFAVDPVQTGQYRVSLTPSTDKLVTVDASAIPQDGVPIALTVGADGGQELSYPKPMVLRATLQRALPIAGATVTAEVQRPSGTIETLALADNGVFPDDLANDGYYAALYDYSEGGVHTVRTSFDNELGAARETYGGRQPSPDITGVEPIQLPDAPITEDFLRSASSQITVLGFVSDDHGDTTDTATSLKPDNSDEPGRNDFAGDVDMFRFTASDPTASYVFRVSEFAKGFTPFVRVFDQDGATVLVEAGLDDGVADRGYFLANLGNLAEGTYFAQVRHEDDKEESGYYNVSFGPALDSDAGGTGAAGTRLRVNNWEMRLRREFPTGEDVFRMSGELNADGLAPNVDGMAFSSTAGLTTIMEQYPAGAFTQGRGGRWYVRQPDRIGDFLVNRGGSSRSLFSVAAVNDYIPLRGQSAVQAGASATGVTDVVDLAAQQLGDLGSYFTYPIQTFRTPELFVDSLVVSDSAAASRDQLRTVCRFPGTARFNPASEDFTVDVAGVQFTAPAGSMTPNRNFTVWSFLADAPGGGRFLLQVAPDSRALSLRAVGTDFPGFTSEQRLTVRYGTFARTNRLTMQTTSGAAGTLFVY
ncbi:MAG: VWA domain-containing protein [Candidatus Sumerlaeia bacterium]|nr:VWA domain-containing protein [Candidatus Sumerlaeia bacterium]